MLINKSQPRAHSKDEVLQALRRASPEDTWRREGGEIEHRAVEIDGSWLTGQFEKGEPITEPVGCLAHGYQYVVGDEAAPHVATSRRAAAAEALEALDGPRIVERGYRSMLVTDEWTFAVDDDFRELFACAPTDDFLFGIRFDGDAKPMFQSLIEKLTDADGAEQLRRLATKVAEISDDGYLVEQLADGKVLVVWDDPDGFITVRVLDDHRVYAHRGLVLAIPGDLDARIRRAGLSEDALREIFADCLAHAEDSEPYERDDYRVEIEGGVLVGFEPVHPATDQAIPHEGDGPVVTMAAREITFADNVARALREYDVGEDDVRLFVATRDPEYTTVRDGTTHVVYVSPEMSVTTEAETNRVVKFYYTRRVAGYKLNGRAIRDSVRFQISDEEIAKALTEGQRRLTDTGSVAVRHSDIHLIVREEVHEVLAANRMRTIRGRTLSKKIVDMLKAGLVTEALIDRLVVEVTPDDSGRGDGTVIWDDGECSMIGTKDELYSVQRKAAGRPASGGPAPGPALTQRGHVHRHVRQGKDLRDYIAERVRDLGMPIPEALKRAATAARDGERIQAWIVDRNGDLAEEADSFWAVLSDFAAKVQTVNEKTALLDVARVVAGRVLTPELEDREGVSREFLSDVMSALASEDPSMGNTIGYTTDPSGRLVLGARRTWDIILDI